MTSEGTKRDHEIKRRFNRHRSPRAARGIGSRARVPAASRSDACTGARAGVAARVMERRASEAGDRRLRAGDDATGKPRLRPARGAHRHLRPGRHLVGRASHLFAGGLLPRPRAGGGSAEAGTQGRGPVQDRAFRQPGGDRQAVAAQSRRNPRCHAHRHVGRRLEAEAKKWLEAAKHPRWKQRYTDLIYSRCSTCCTCAPTVTRLTS